MSLLLCSVTFCLFQMYLQPLWSALIFYYLLLSDYWPSCYMLYREPTLISSPPSLPELKGQIICDSSNPQSGFYWILLLFLKTFILLQRNSLVSYIYFCVWNAMLHLFDVKGIDLPCPNFKVYLYWYFGGLRTYYLSKWATHGEESPFLMFHDPFQHLSLFLRSANVFLSIAWMLEKVILNLKTTVNEQNFFTLILHWNEWNQELKHWTCNVEKAWICCRLNIEDCLAVSFQSAFSRFWVHCVTDARVL